MFVLMCHVVGGQGLVKCLRKPKLIIMNRTSGKGSEDTEAGSDKVPSPFPPHTGLQELPLPHLTVAYAWEPVGQESSRRASRSTTAAGLESSVPPRVIVAVKNED